MVTITSAEGQGVGLESCITCFSSVLSGSGSWYSYILLYVNTILGVVVLLLLLLAFSCGEHSHRKEQLNRVKTA
jgi:hypothetical protein